MRILIVEDSKRVAMALREALRGSYVVDVEHSGRAALANINLLSYDVILLDLGLPDMSGREVCEQLRAQKVGAPVIIVTGDDTVIPRRSTKLACRLVSLSSIRPVVQCAVMVRILSFAARNLTS